MREIKTTSDEREREKEKGEEAEKGSCLISRWKNGKERKEFRGVVTTITSGLIGLFAIRVFKSNPNFTQAVQKICTSIRVPLESWRTWVRHRRVWFVSGLVPRLTSLILWPYFSGNQAAKGRTETLGGPQVSPLQMTEQFPLKISESGKRRTSERLVCQALQNTLKAPHQLRHWRRRILSRRKAKERSLYKKISEGNFMTTSKRVS